MEKYFLLLAAGLILALTGCATHPDEWEGDNGITQVAPIDALVSGVYDGWYPVSELQSRGDVGIGTFDGLDGELIMVDRKIYKVRADGRVYSPDFSEMTPFAVVASFNPDTILLVSAPTTMAELQAKINKEISKNNLPVVIRAEGKFEWVKTRSVPQQFKPYPPLVKVTASQPEFNIKNVDGVVIGFRMPVYIRGINMPGYHLHFISDNHDSGGHVLELRMLSGKIFLGAADKVTLLLPRNLSAFANTDFQKDRSAELKKSEK